MICLNEKELTEGFIVFDGIYVSNETEEMVSHTEESWSLYLKGLNSFEGEIGDGDYLEGVQIQKNNNLAQWHVQGRRETLIEVANN